MHRTGKHSIREKRIQKLFLKKIIKKHNKTPYENITSITSNHTNLSFGSA